MDSSPSLQTWDNTSPRLVIEKFNDYPYEFYTKHYMFMMCFYNTFILLYR